MARETEAGSLLSSGQSREMKRMLAEMAKQSRATLASAAQAGFKAQDLAKVSKNLLDVRKKAADQQAHFDQLQHRAALAHEDAIAKKRLDREAEIAKKRLEASNATFKRESENVTKIANRMKAAKAAVKDKEGGGLVGGANWASGVANDLADEISKAVTSKDPFHMADALKRFGKMTGAKGADIQSKATSGTGQDIGALLSKIGPMIAGIGAVALGLAAFVKIAIDADTKIKELNKEVMGAGITISDLTNDAQNVDKALKQVHGAFTGLVGTGSKAFAFVQDWGNTAKDNIAILNAFSAAGYTAEKMIGGFLKEEDVQQRLRDVAESALIYSKLLGESADKIATDQGEMLRTLSTSLEGVQDRFSEITQAAKESGFSVKRFYAMVLEMTGGMDMYNVRMGETLGMLTQLGKVIGQNAAKEMTAANLKGFRGMGTKDRTLAVMKMGEHTAARIAKGEARSGAGVLQETFKKLQTDTTTDKSKETAAKLDAALEQWGFKGLDAAQTAEKASGMSQASMQEFSASLNSIKDTLGTKFEDVWKASQGGKGKGGAQLALSSFGAVGTMLAKKHALDAIPGMGGDISKIDAKNIPKRIALEEQSGMSADEVGTMEKGLGQVAGLQNALKKGTVTQSMLDMFKLTRGKDGSLQDQRGNKVDAKDGDELFRNWLEQKEKDDAAKKDALTKDQEFAKSTADATTTIADRMESVVEGLLTTIAEGVSWITSHWPWGGQSDEDKEAKAKAMDAVSKEITDLTTKRADTKDLGEKAAIAAEIAQKRAALTGMRTDKGEGTAEDFKRRGELSTLSAEDRNYLLGQKNYVAEDKQYQSWQSDGEGGMTLVKDEAAIAKAQKKLEEDMLKKKQASDKKLAEKSKNPEQAKLDAEAAQKLKDKADEEALATYLMWSGADKPDELAQKLRSGQPLTGDDAKWGKKTGIEHPEWMKAPAHDFVAHFGREGFTGGQRIDPGDSIIGAKNQGALSKMGVGGKGGNTFHVHVYQGEGVVDILRRAVESGVVN